MPLALAINAVILRRLVRIILFLLGIQKMLFLENRMKLAKGFERWRVWSEKSKSSGFGEEALEDS
jgi:hypothetical protein